MNSTVHLRNHTTSRARHFLDRVREVCRDAERLDLLDVGARRRRPLDRLAAREVAQQRQQQQVVHREAPRVERRRAAALATAAEEALELDEERADGCGRLGRLLLLALEVEAVLRPRPLGVPEWTDGGSENCAELRQHCARIARR